jgi:hypothetical protein
MKIVFYINLFIICCNSFILQPPSILHLNNKKYSINTYKPITNNILNLKKNNDYDEKYKEDITRLTINLVYNVILYSYIFYLLNLKHLI